jgi:hypothetical protein
MFIMHSRDIGALPRRPDRLLAISARCDARRIWELGHFNEDWSHPPRPALHATAAAHVRHTAIEAEIMGPAGRVAGVEIDPELAGRARANLADGRMSMSWRRMAADTIRVRSMR